MKHEGKKQKKWKHFLVIIYELLNGKKNSLIIKLKSRMKVRGLNARPISI